MLGMQFAGKTWLAVGAKYGEDGQRGGAVVIGLKDESLSA